MLVAVAFSNAETARKIADALGRSGLRALALTSGAAVLRQKQAVSLVVSGARLEDMTVLRLRQLLPAEIPILALTQNVKPLQGLYVLPATLTRAQLCEHILKLLGAQDACVARAKRVLIQKGGLDEQRAHRILQKNAMDLGIPLKRAAEMILRKYGEET